MVNVLTIFLCILFFVPNRLQGRILTGRLLTHENWAFLARFCFLTEKGKFRYDLTIGGEGSNVNLLLYYDAATQWPSVYPSNKTCTQKESVLSVERGQIVPLSTTNAMTSGCVPVNDEETRCRSYREFRSSRPRWWFIAVSDCSSRNGLNLTYWMSLTNAAPGTFWREHFSADEFYILPELLVAAALYMILVGLSIRTAVELRSRRLLHASYKLFMSSLAFQLSGIVLESASYINRGLHGVDLPGILLLGNLLQTSSDMLYTILLMLLALGYTVTKSALTPVQVRRLTCFILISIFLQLSLFVYQADVFDPGEVLYLYESPPGYALITIKLLIWIVFVTCCFRTSKNTPTKFRFYASLVSLGSCWYLCHPLTILGITLLVDKWMRESVVKGCFLWIVFLGHATFLYITRPATANTRFPFHIRTCQVVPIMGEGQNHSYEPRSRAAAIPSFTIAQLPSPRHHS